MLILHNKACIEIGRFSEGIEFLEGGLQANFQRCRLGKILIRRVDSRLRFLHFRQQAKHIEWVDSSTSTRPYPSSHRDIA